MTTYTVTIKPWDWVGLSHGDKHFLVLPEVTHVWHIEDVLHMETPAWPGRQLRGTIVYIECGVGYAPDHVGIELREILEVVLPTGHSPDGQSLSKGDPLGD